MRQKIRLAAAAAAVVGLLAGTALAAAGQWNVLDFYFEGDNTPADDYVNHETYSVSDDNYTQIVSGLTGNDTVAYDSAAASTDTYYDDGGYYEADAEGTEGEEGADAANSMVDEEEPENGTVPAEEPVEAEEKQGSAGDDVNPSQADGVVYLG